MIYIYTVHMRMYIQLRGTRVLYTIRNANFPHLPGEGPTSAASAFSRYASNRISVGEDHWKKVSGWWFQTFFIEQSSQLTNIFQRG